MDDIKKCERHLVGPGGKKCFCCFDYKSTRGKKPGFSKIRRTRFKRLNDKIIEDSLD